MGTISVRGNSEGTSSVEVSVAAVDDDEGGAIQSSANDGSLTVRP